MVSGCLGVRILEGQEGEIIKGQRKLWGIGICVDTSIITLMVVMASGLCTYVRTNQIILYIYVSSLYVYYTSVKLLKPLKDFLSYVFMSLRTVFHQPRIRFYVASEG